MNALRVQTALWRNKAIPHKSSSLKLLKYIISDNEDKYKIIK